MEKTFREVIRDIKEDEIWEDVENDGFIKIHMENNEVHISSVSSGLRIKKLSISIDEATFKKIKR